MRLSPKVPSKSFLDLASGAILALEKQEPGIFGLSSEVLAGISLIAVRGILIFQTSGMLTHKI